MQRHLKKQDQLKRKLNQQVNLQINAIIERSPKEFPNRQIYEVKVNFEESFSSIFQESSLLVISYKCRSSKMDRIIQSLLSLSFKIYFLYNIYLKNPRKYMKTLNKRKNNEKEDLYIPLQDRSARKEWKRWTKKENEKYIMFLELYKDSFLTQYKRRVSRVFKGLSLTVQTKSQNQCKSHHQKMMKKFNDDIEEIISGIKTTLETDSLSDEHWIGKDDTVNWNDSDLQQKYKQSHSLSSSQNIFDVLNSFEDDKSQKK